MIKSKHNIVSKVLHSDQFYVVNLLSGNADLLSEEEAKALLVGEQEQNGNPELMKDLAEKGYLVTAENENKLYRNRYFDFVDQRGDEEVQLFFVPNYSCNFSCSYCYQDEYTNPHQSATPELIKAFFEYVRKELPNRRKYLTIFGGEPLLNTPHQRELIALMVEKSNEAGIDICVVTNGYYLENYIELLSKGKIREIQITLDGTKKIHDQRRFLKGGSPTFEPIVRGIDAALAAGFPVNLRMVIDKQNIENLPGLATFAIEKGWTSHHLFKTQIGRNYELHHCQSTPDQLFTRISLFHKIFELTEVHPHILEFYKPSYSVAKYLSENGTLPDPLFDACPACKSEWAFDYTGRIYSCTATVGKEEEALGTFYPEITRNEQLIHQWVSRDVTSIEECRNCSVQLACGGGCGSVAKNKNGSILSPDCRPVKELLEIGFKAYFGEELTMES
ncbi:MAG: radical SAM protein [Prolixibacteraceae bacterium]|nr:radical SAM protein [Prolixibacteraceae bacterium]